MSLTQPPSSHNPTIAGQHLIFTLGAECYALNILHLRDILAWCATGRTSDMPHYQHGVMHAENEKVPVYDLNAPFRNNPPREGEAHTVLLASLDGRTIGLIIDEITDLIELHGEEITLLPKQDIGGNSSLIQGIFSRDQRMVALLDIAPLVGTNTQQAWN